MISTEIIINAPVSEVWALTTAVESWPELTPTIRSVRLIDRGPLRVGSRARVQQPAQPPATWTVTRLVPEREFVWQTKLATITMVGGHHLEPVDKGCRNTLTLELSGFGSGLFERLLGSRLRSAIVTENAGFKRNEQSRPPRAATEGGGREDDPCSRRGHEGRSPGGRGAADRTLTSVEPASVSGRWSNGCTWKRMAAHDPVAPRVTNRPPLASAPP